MTDHPETGAPNAQRPEQDAGRDNSLQERLVENPSDLDAKLDVALDQSMDASDASAPLQPGDDGEPMPSSGYDDAAEEELRNA